MGKAPGFRINSFKSPLFLLRFWNRVQGLPAGKLLFRKALGFAVPYTNTIYPEVCELRPGYAKIQMQDRKIVRNHVGSIHAIALANLAEVSSGLALNCGLPENGRAILKTFSIEYTKKGRGLLTAECSAPVLSSIIAPGPFEERDVEVEVVTQDSSGAVVTRAKAVWLVGSVT